MARNPLAGRVAAAVSLVILSACGDSPPERPAQAPGGRPAPVGGGDADGAYERSIVFASMDGESIVLVPWLMSAVETPDGVERYGAGWLGRGGLWEAFYEERWTTPPTRAPARVLPHGSVSLLVRDGDAIDGILFEEGPRNLELVIGDVTANWVGSRGETIELLEGATYLSDQRIDGAVLDMARASAGGSPPGGDWAFLISGDSARFVLLAETEHGGETEPRYRGWADLGGSSLQWPEVAVDWSRTQAFPPARRDVPVEWRFRSADGLVEGALAVVSADITPGEGPGPLLPVRALFEVAGEVSTVAGRFDVRGLVVHERR
jgi:hypothetical protein